VLMCRTAREPHAEHGLNSCSKPSPPAVCHLTVRLFGLGSCSDEAVAYVQLSAALRSKRSPVLSALLVLGGCLGLVGAGVLPADACWWKYPRRNPGRESAARMLPRLGSYSSVFKAVVCRRSSLRCELSIPVFFSAEARRNIWLSARHIQEVSGTVSAWSCVKFSSNQNTSPTVPAASLCQNQHIIKERWINLLSKINYIVTESKIFFFKLSCA